MNEPIHIISLGAGVQSSTMALMAAAGEITPMPVAAIFADTQHEPASVYRWLEWLTPRLPFQVIRVTNGSLMARNLYIRNHKKKPGLTWVPSAVPAFTSGPDGRGHLPRQCTRDSKINPLLKEQNRLRKATGASRVISWVGISLDEAHRIKPAGRKWCENRWPLVELNLSRTDCLKWMRDHNYPAPPRSACSFCPYHSDAEWQRLKTEEPDAFAEAITFDRKFRELAAAVNTRNELPYLHESLKPLDQVDFLAWEAKKKKRAAKPLQHLMTLGGFGNECEGMCGV